jgi:putative two-component system response regulator
LRTRLALLLAPELARPLPAVPTAEVGLARTETLERLARAAEFRDDDTQQHAERIGLLAAMVGAELGLSAERVDDLRRAAPLHDVGKLAVPDAILLKPGRLDAGEFAIMRRHTTAGARILAGSSSPVLRLAEQIALTHHERWDGGGYPRGLGGERIPLAGRIVAVVDVFDALTHERPYKSAWPVTRALDEIAAGAGTQFDPQVVEAFLALARRDALISPALSAAA